LILLAHPAPSVRHPAGFVCPATGPVTVLSRRW
jgi:hypothetical protein